MSLHYVMCSCVCVRWCDGCKYHYKRKQLFCLVFCELLFNVLLGVVLFGVVLLGCVTLYVVLLYVFRLLFFDVVYAVFVFIIGMCHYTFMCYVFMACCSQLVLCYVTSGYIMRCIVFHVYIPFVVS